MTRIVPITWAVFVDGVAKGHAIRKYNRLYWERPNNAGVDPMPPRATLTDLCDWARKCCNGKTAEVRDTE